MPRFGFIRTKDDIKFLVLYALQFLEFPVSFSTIVDLCTWCDDGFGFLELKEAFLEMVQSGHITEIPKEKEPYFEISPLGKEAAKIFEQDLPRTTRTAAQASALRIIRNMKRDAALQTSVSKLAEHDLIVNLHMEDVFSLHFHVVNMAQAEMLQSQFKKHAEKIYQVVLDSLICDYSNPEAQLK